MPLKTNGFGSLRLSSHAHAVIAEEGISTLDELRKWADYSNEKFHAAFRERPKELMDEIHRAVARFVQLQGSKFEERYVAYLDILGFSRLVEDADSSHDAREVIRSSLIKFLETVSGYPNPELQFSQFSDNLVLSSRRNENGLFYIVDMCIRLSFNLFMQGVLVRGGVALGNLEHTENLLFGSGLIIAHRHDASGGPPRIVLEDRCLADWRDSRLCKEMWQSAVREDPYDLSSMIHTLLFAETYDPQSEGRHPLSLPEAERVVGLMKTRSTNMLDPPDVRAKWRWMAAYWNSVVTKEGHLPLV